MTLENWLNNAWLEKHKTSKQEIYSLLGIVERNLNDVDKDISSDSKFGLAYNSALTLCTILLYSEGFKAVRSQHHHRTIQTLPLILGTSKKSDAEYLDTCRSKRNILDYDYAGGVSSQDALELIDFVKTFKQEIITWLTQNHPEYL